MNNNKTAKKSLLFALMMIICITVGIVFGYTVSTDDSQKVLESVTKLIKNKSVYVIAPLYVIWSIVSLIYQLLLLRKGKRSALSVSPDDDDDTAFDEAGKMLEAPIEVSNIIIIISCILFSILIECAVFSKEISKNVAAVLGIGGSVLFIIFYLTQFIIVRHVIELIKKLCPEKQGDLLDMNFQKKWLSSFDEGEKFIAYKCGFNAYKNANTACMILWIISFISQFTFNTGIMPIICIGIIWAVLVVSYTKENRRLEKGKTNNTDE